MPGTMITGWLYRHAGRPVLFQFNPERVHTAVTNVGEVLGRVPPARHAIATLFHSRNALTEQTWLGITFRTPFGLAAGFDYEAKLTEILPAFGFGFQTVGTITNQPCPGNDSPRLGRLVRSRSLMVNKGFRNPGVQEIVQKLETRSFSTPVGISIGQTNIATIRTVADAIHDIVSAFTVSEKSAVPFSYYELNISCPNLHAEISFYEQKSLSRLLTAIDTLELSRPVLVKMPISVTNTQFDAMLDAMLTHHIDGVIVGNLQKDRTDPAIDQQELARFPTGNFSGRPTQARSDALIRRAYQRIGKHLLIVGCGGVFTAEDAYRKIRAGASLIQLITGLIFEGPQLISQLNRELEQRLRTDGFTHVSQAVGIDV